MAQSRLSAQQKKRSAKRDANYSLDYYAVLKRGDVIRISGIPFFVTQPCRIETNTAGKLHRWNDGIIEWMQSGDLAKQKPE